MLFNRGPLYIDGDGKIYGGVDKEFIDYYYNLVVRRKDGGVEMGEMNGNYQNVAYSKDSPDGVGLFHRNNQDNQDNVNANVNTGLNKNKKKMTMERNTLMIV
jgi:hypothetical protein